MLRINEMVAGIEVAVMLDDDDVPAGLAKNAERMLHPQRRPRRLVENLDDDAPDIVPHPLVENGAEKLAEGLRRHRLKAYPTLAVIQSLYKGKELQVLDADLLKEAVNLRRVVDVLVVDHAEEIAMDLMLL